MDIKMRINKNITSAGIVGQLDVTDESKIRIVIEDADSGNEIVVRAKIIGQSDYTVLETFTGNTNSVVGVFTYEKVEIECTSYSSTGQFVKVISTSFNQAGGSAIDTIGVPSGDDLTNIENLELVSSDGSINIVGDNLTKTIDFTAALTYTPADSSDWSPVPTTLDGGLDQLADRVTTVEADLLNKIDSTEKGAANGVAPLNSISKIDAIYLPSFVDDVEEYSDLLSFPLIGEFSKIYVALDSNKTYRWSGSIYVEISPSEVNSVNGYTGIVNLTKSDVGLGNIDNTSDLDKPISTDTQDALDLKVDKAGDTMTGSLNMSALSENIQFSVYGLNATSEIEIKSDDDSTRPTGNVKLSTGDASNSDGAGSIYLEGGSNVDGNPANIILTAGQSTGTGPSGSIILDSKQVVYLNQNPTGYIDAVNHNIQNVLDPVSPQDAATKKWVEDISTITGVLFVDSTASLFGADGSLFRPFTTIADAISEASDNSVIAIFPGAYSEPEVIIPSTISYLTIKGISQGSVVVSNGFSYTSPAGNIDILFEEMNLGSLNIDASSATSGLITLKQATTSIDRTDSNANVFLTISESTIFGGTCYGAGNVSECLIISNIDIYSPIFIFENCKFVSSVTVYGNSLIRILDSNLFGASEFAYGNIVMGDTPTIQIDTTSDALGGLAGTYTKVLLASIPVSNIAQSGAATNQVIKYNGISWSPGYVNASSVQYTPVDSTDWSPSPTLTNSALDQLANRIDLVETGGASTSSIFTDTKEPTGFLNRTDSVISFNDLTREFTIQPTGASFDIYIKGVKYSKTAPEILTIPASDGNHYIYYDNTGSLATTTTFTSAIIEQYAFIAIVYWNSEIGSHVYFAEERHGITMDGTTHAYLHTILGARYLSGLALQGFTVNGPGNSDIDAQFTSDSGSIRDEDILHVLPAQTQIPVYYRQGQLWRRKAPNGFPFIYSGTAGYTGASGRLPYNQYTGGAWQLTEIANNAFILVHYFATNDIDDHVIAIQGTNTYGNVTAARVAASTEITALSGLPFAEFVPIGSVVLESSDSFSNTPKAIVRSVNGGDYVDFRGTQLYTPAGEATTHGLLSGLSNDDHPQYLTQARAETSFYTETEVDSLLSVLQADVNSRAYSSLVIEKDGSVPFTGSQSMGGFKLTNLSNPTSSLDAVNLQTLNAALGSSGDIIEKSFYALSNQSIPANITDFVFPNSSVRSFNALVSAQIVASSNLYEVFEIRGIQKDSDWVISINSEGDDSGINFTITNSGQIQYTSSAYSGFTSSTIKFRAITTSA